MTPEQALQIGEELCDRFLQGNYQYVLAVHTDKSHTHCHIIFNNTNLYNGLSFTYEHNQGKVKDRSWAQLRAISDELCKEHGISVIEPKSKGVSHFEKMKHRDELEPVYKEYQGKSGWSQSRFKKKNADTIEDYEATVKYIKEHIKRYAVDGKPPTMLDLLEKSNKLKSKWNRLNVEHTAFLTKRETAKKYTRQVRQYINEQQMKREREKYRQKKLTQQRKKDTLE